jgi:hypothetical protein
VSGEDSAEPLVPNAGEWAVYLESPRYYPYRCEVRRIASVTPKLIKFEEQGWPRQIGRDDLRATLPNKHAADLLCQSLNGVSGEYERREEAARIEFSAKKASARLAADRVTARLIASAMSARQGQDAQQLGAHPASAVRDSADAKPPAKD